MPSVQTQRADFRFATMVAIAMGDGLCAVNVGIQPVTTTTTTTTVAA